MHQPAARGRGFTLVEMLLVMVVIGLLASVALPRLTDRSALQARGFVEELRAMLRHGRKVAMTQQRTVCVLLTATQARAVYDPGPGCDVNAPLDTPGRSEPFVINVPSGLVLGGVAQLRFNAAGQPVPNANQVIVAGTQTITVSRETGVTR